MAFIAFIQIEGTLASLRAHQCTGRVPMYTRISVGIISLERNEPGCAASCTHLRMENVFTRQGSGEPPWVAGKQGGRVRSCVLGHRFSPTYPLCVPVPLTYIHRPSLVFGHFCLVTATRIKPIGHGNRVYLPAAFSTKLWGFTQRCSTANFNGTWCELVTGVNGYPTYFSTEVHSGPPYLALGLPLPEYNKRSSSAIVRAASFFFVRTFEFRLLND